MINGMTHHPRTVARPTKWRLNQKIKEEFDANGIVIPYNQMEVYVHQQK